GRDVEKPARKLHSEIRALIRALEASGKARRTEAAIRVAELDQDGLDRIQWFLESRRRQCALDGKEHDLTLQFKNPTRGIGLYISTDGSISSSATRHATMRKELSGAHEWLVISLAADGATADFTFLPRDSPLVPAALSRIEHVRRERLAEFIQAHGSSPGRNDPCPCTSGKKFKKCCALLRVLVDP